MSDQVVRPIPNLTQIRGAITNAKQLVTEYAEATTDQLDALIRQLGTLGARDFDQEALDAFLKEPYCAITAGENKWRVIVPRWVDFHIGWLEKTTASYNVFLVDRYAQWLGEVPDAYRDVFSFPAQLDAKLDLQAGVMEVGPSDQDETWRKYGDHFKTRRGGSFYVKKGHEYLLIADMVRGGTLPFQPRPVAQQDLLPEPVWKTPIELRDYQAQAWERFLATGAIGIYWPTGAGKTYPAIYAMAHLKGRKVIVVPTRTLKEQWVERLNHHLTGGGGGIEVITYQGADKIRRQYTSGAMRNEPPPVLIVFDECHRLPANTFSKLSTLPAKYRMGLSATPYREDGRTDLIFALTGFPLGMDWRGFLDKGVVPTPTVTVYVDYDQAAKDQRLGELLQDRDARTLIFCDGIDKGKTMEKRFGVPFVHGATSKRLDVVRANGTVIMSRVGDEGISLPDLERVIEYDFHAGSRRQEAQRMGRLMHAEEPGEHFVLMTLREYELHSKRLLAIQDKGIKIHLKRGRGV